MHSVLEEAEQELHRVRKCRLSIEERPGRGRGLFAQQDLDVGQEVLAEQPLAFCLLPEQIATRCDYTLKASEKLLRCSKSKVARYSSREAQAKAWKDYYRSECEALTKLRSHGLPSTTARLLSRMYWRRERDLLRWNIVSKLENHWVSFSDTRKIQLTQTANAVKALLMHDGSKRGEGDALDLRDILMTLAIVVCNAHTICDDELKPIAVGMYPVASFCNHSCKPNCVQVYRGKEIIYKCMRPVASGEELTISYVDLCSLESERRDILLQNYFFDLRPPPPPQPQPAAEAEAATLIAGEAFPIELFAFPRAGLVVGSATPSGLVSEEESPFVSIVKCGDVGAREEIGKGFVTNQELSGGHDPQQQGALRPLIHLGTNLSDTMGETVKVVCSFIEKEDSFEWATKCARIAGRFLERIHQVLLRTERLTIENQFEEAYSSLKEIHELCNKGVVVLGNSRLTLGEMHISRVRVLSLLLHVTLQLGSHSDFETARKVAKELIEPYKAFYGKNSPVYGFHLGMVAKLHAYFGDDLESVISLCRESLGILSAMLPSDNKSTAEIEQIMNDTLAELNSRERERAEHRSIGTDDD